MTRPHHLAAALAALTLGALSASALAEIPLEQIMSDTNRIARLRLSMGRKVVNPNSGKGLVAFVSAQDKLALEDVSLVADKLADSLGFTIRAVRGDKALDAAANRAAQKADLAIVIVDDPKLPVSLVAPEERWAVVNVAKLGDDKRFRPRARKALLRAFSFLCGGACSAFPENLTDVAGVDGLDKVFEGLPADMTGRYMHYLETVGLTRIEVKPYRMAAAEGWAPPPKDDDERFLLEKGRIAREKRLARERAKKGTK